MCCILRQDGVNRTSYVSYISQFAYIPISNHQNDMKKTIQYFVVFKQET